MVRTVTKKAKDAIVDAAQGVRTMAGEAFGAATKAAADVVFEVNGECPGGRSRAAPPCNPGMENALGNAARRSVAKRRSNRRKTAATRKRGVKRKAAGKKKAVKARRTARRRRVSLASINEPGTAGSGALRSAGTRVRMRR